MITRPSKTGKLLVNDKATLLELASTIADKTEYVAQEKINKTKAAISFNLSKKKTAESDTFKHKKTSSSSDRLRAAKHIVASRKAKQKREKTTRARKGSDKQIVQSGSGSIGDGLINTTLSSPISMTTKPKPKRVAFA